MTNDLDLINWAKTQTWSNFAQSVADRAAQYGNKLTDRQRAALQGMRDKAAPAAPAAPNPALAGFDGVETILRRIEASGNAWPKVRLKAGPHAVALTLMTAGNNTGSVRVTIGQENSGYIRNGQWTPNAAASNLPREDKALVWELFKALKADPEKTFADFGHRTGTCACCGHPLSNPESVALGIGPVCRAKAFG